jgi:hypothetical protein
MSAQRLSDASDLTDAEWHFVLAQWVASDRVDGDARRLRRWLEGWPQAYPLLMSGQA